MSVWNDIAERVREIKARPQLEHWRVAALAPLRLRKIGGDGTLEEGDDDLTIGGSVEMYRTATPLVVGDVLCLIHAAEEWIAIDVLPNG